MDGSAPADALKGAIVIIGAGAVGLGDIKATPLAIGVPGAEADAQVIEQVLLQNFLRRPDWAAGAELIYLILLGACLILGLPRFGAARSAIFTAIVFAAVFASSWYAFASLHLLFDPVYPSLVALCIYLTASLINQLQTESEKRRVRTCLLYTSRCFHGRDWGGQHAGDPMSAALASSTCRDRQGRALTAAASQICAPETEIGIIPSIKSDAVTA